MALPLLLLLGAGAVVAVAAMAPPAAPARGRELSRRRMPPPAPKGPTTLPITGLATFVASAVYPTPFSVVSLALPSPLWKTLLELVAGGHTIDGKPVTDAQAQGWLFDRLWNVVALGVDTAGGTYGWIGWSDAEWKAAGSPMPPSRRDIVAAALAWELSPLGPAGSNDAHRLGRLIGRARQIIASPNCATLASVYMYDDPLGKMLTWTAGSPAVCKAHQKQWTQQLDALVNARGPVTARNRAQLIRDVVGFIANLAAWKYKRVNYAEGFIPGPKVNWGAVFSFGISFIMDVLTGDYASAAASTVEFADTKGGTEQGGTATEAARTAKGWA